MKKLFTFLTVLLVTANIWAQSPEKMSYQAVVRNAENELIKSQEVGMQISILQGSIYGASVYVETQTTTTNENGLLSIEIGSEEATILFGAFAEIDWADGPYILKTETDPEGGANYTITGTSQLLSVPFALHAKTAESIAGDFTITETDPVYTESQAANITATDITNLENLSGVNTGDQDLSNLATKTQLNDYATITALGDLATKAALIDTAMAIREKISTLSGGSSEPGTETDPVFMASEAANITATDITNLGKLSGENTGDQDLTPYATKAKVLTTDNTTAFTPDADYEPATKKYVDDNDTIPTYKVGEFAHGGIIFWVDESGQHGLVCAKEDQEAAMRWYAGTAGSTRATGDGPYSGEGNTFITIAATVAIGDDGATFAARVCNELQVTQGSSTYGDWYLPSKEELILMIQKKTEINATATDNGGAAFAADSYWSSTESASLSAYIVDASGISGAANKADTHGVRAIRAF